VRYDNNCKSDSSFCPLPAKFTTLHDRPMLSALFLATMVCKVVFAIFECRHFLRFFVVAADIPVEHLRLEKSFNLFNLIFVFNNGNMRDYWANSHDRLILSLCYRVPTPVLGFRNKVLNLKPLIFTKLAQNTRFHSNLCSETPSSGCF